MPSKHPSRSCHRSRGKTLGVPELIAIALGGMVGGGIFSILGISVALVGVYTPLVIAIGGVLAGLAAYSYIKLGVFFRDEGGAYSFFKRSFPASPFAASLIGWWVIFGYISTLALYAYTFSSYAISGFGFADDEPVRKLVAGGIILVFTLINLWSVRGMGRIEDLMVYTKLVILAIVSFVLIDNGEASLPTLLEGQAPVGLLAVLIVAALTIVAYEGFELVINAIEEMDTPERNIPRAIYAAIVLATLIYLVIGVGAILAIPFDELIANKEYALAAGAEGILGDWGTELVIIGALLATSSAISGTVFGASRQMAAIADDGFMPSLLARRSGHIPVAAIVCMSSMAFGLILIGNLEMILEFGSITFLLVSLLMAWANLRMRDRTGASAPLIWLALVGLLLGTVLILYYEWTNEPRQLIFIMGLYLALTVSARLFSSDRRSHRR
ncbi:APC family permease [Wenzhouxiangella marina]|uniref:Amino acid permease n=1 Tax=Wenzhouxiangella marina TaxID=1579979 RepID=A0A0K0XT33_9GAMM|nr:APC family permease [Wenzhouxiangella marina]AKS40782.1 amino acid permease [Wenzhouxiangella marina]MBB6087655.1 amino acid transporter [Wenzhouxiangella marina]